jgi:hypothetical protein
VFTVRPLRRGTPDAARALRPVPVRREGRERHVGINERMPGAHGSRLRVHGVLIALCVSKNVRLRFPVSGSCASTYQRGRPRTVHFRGLPLMSSSSLRLRPGGDGAHCEGDHLADDEFPPFHSGHAVPMKAKPFRQGPLGEFHPPPQSPHLRAGHDVEYTHRIHQSSTGVARAMWPGPPDAPAAACGSGRPPATGRCRRGRGVAPAGGCTRGVWAPRRVSAAESSRRARASPVLTPKKGCRRPRAAARAEDPRRLPARTPTRRVVAAAARRASAGDTTPAAARRRGRAA